jgi:hypothetical protein
VAAVVKGSDALLQVVSVKYVVMKSVREVQDPGTSLDPFRTDRTARRTREFPPTGTKLTLEESWKLQISKASDKDRGARLLPFEVHGLARQPPHSRSLPLCLFAHYSLSPET